MFDCGIPGIMLGRVLERGWRGERYQHKTDDNGETGDLNSSVSHWIE